MNDRGKLLIIDDGKNIRLTLKRALNNAGYSVKTAGSGEIGLQMLQEDKYPVVLLDFKLPGMDGWEVMEKIKKEDYPVSIIMMSDYNDSESFREMEDTDVIKYLDKPFDFDEVIKLVNNLMD